MLRMVLQTLHEGIFWFRDIADRRSTASMTRADLECSHWKRFRD